MTPKPKRRLQLAAAVQTFKKFLKTEKLVLFCQINLDKTTAFSPVWVKSGSGRMTKEMRLIFEKGKWNDKRDTPAAAPPPCRLHFLMFSALHAEKAALLRRKNAFGRTTALLAPRMPSQNKKAIPYGMTFCFGGDKRDRTADLMTASCYRFVIFERFYVKYVRSVNKKYGISQDFAHCVHTLPRTLGSQSGSGELGGFGEVLPGWMWIVT